MFLVIFGIFLVGLWILVRILSEDIKKHLIEDALMTKIVAGIFLWWLVGLVISFKNVFLIVAWLLFPILLIAFFMPIFYQWKRSLFHSETRAYLDRIVLHIRAGESARTALRKSTLGGSLKFQLLMEQLLEAVSFSQHPSVISKDPFMSTMYEFIKEISHETHLSLRKVENFRKKLQIESTYSRKVQKVTRTSRIQAFIMSVLYSALLVVVLKKEGFQALNGMVFLSIFLFLSGIFIILWVGRSYRWKV